LTDLLLVGTVARAHGNKGHVIVNPETDFAQDRFAVGNDVIVEQGGLTATRKITAVRFHDGRPILALDGVDTMDDAEALAGAELKMPADALGALPADTFYRHDLVGCEVQDRAGHAIGRVTDVEGPLERSLLIVARRHGEVMVPMAAGIVVEVDTIAKRIVVELPEGLLDVNSEARASDSE